MSYFSIPIYVVNTILGPLFILMIGILIVIIGKDFVLNLIINLVQSGYENGAPDNVINAVIRYSNVGIIFAMTLMGAVMPVTSCSISLEGKELWILKANPISSKDVFLAKLLVNVALYSVPVLATSILLCSQIGFEYFVYVFLILIFITLLSSVIGLYSNLLLPKFEYESEMQVVKQSAAVLVSMGLNTLMVLANIGLVILLKPNSEIAIFGLITIVFGLMTVIWSVVLATHGKKLYHNL